jgi:CheY-like chemotaxis protein
LLVPPRKILLVEDEIPYAKFLIDVFADYEPAFEIFHVNNGQAALALLNSGYHPDLILSDMRMPKMGGHELAARVKDNPTYQDVPFYIVSAASCEEDTKKGLACMADLHIAKPANFKQMLDLIERLKIAFTADSVETSAGVSLTIH